jgi:hypothetical protein
LENLAFSASKTKLKQPQKKEFAYLAKNNISNTLVSKFSARLPQNFIKKREQKNTHYHLLLAAECWLWRATLAKIC